MRDFRDIYKGRYKDINPYGSIYIIQNKTDDLKKVREVLPYLKLSCRMDKVIRTMKMIYILTPRKQHLQGATTSGISTRSLSLPMFNQELMIDVGVAPPK